MKKKTKQIILWSALVLVLIILGIIALLLYPAINFDRLKTKLEGAPQEERHEIITELKSVNPVYFGDLQPLFERHDADLSWNLSDLFHTTGLVSLKIGKSAGGDPSANIQKSPKLSTLTDYAKFYIALYYLDEQKDSTGIESLIPNIIAKLPFPQVETELVRRLMENAGAAIEEEIAKALADRETLSNVTFKSFKKIMDDSNRDWKVRFIIANFYMSLPASDEKRAEAVKPLISLAEEAVAKKNYAALTGIVKKLASTRRNDVPPLLETLLDPGTVNDLPDTLTAEAARALADFGIRRHGELMLRALCVANGQILSRALVESALAILGKSSFDEIRKSLLECKTIERRYEGLAFLASKGDSESLEHLVSTVSRTSQPTAERVLAADALAVCAKRTELEKLERIHSVEQDATVKNRIGQAIEIIRKRLD